MGEQWIKLERYQGLDPIGTGSHVKELMCHPRTVKRPLKDC